MSTKTATSTTGDVLSQWQGTFVLTWAKLAHQLPQEEIRSREVRIKTYIPVLHAANAWLSVIEERIRASIRPDKNEGEESTEWLNSHAAAEAISFFRSVADLLPTEPHISATRSGDLVAEFETSTCSKHPHAQ